MRFHRLTIVCFSILCGCASSPHKDARGDLLKPVHSGSPESNAMNELKDGKVHGSMSMSTGFGAGRTPNGVGNVGPLGGW